MRHGRSHIGYNIDMNTFQDASNTDGWTPRPWPVVKFKKLVPHAIIPTRGTPLSAGLDLYSAEDLVIPPGAFRAVSSGLAIELPPEYEGQVRARSGTALRAGIGIVNGIGTIDEDYRGEIKTILINHGREPFQIRIGDRIAQLIVASAPRIPVIEVQELTPSDRGTNGFGSTGR